MVYKYTIYGKVHNSDRKISYSASIPMGISTDEMIDRIKAFAKSVDLIKFELH